MKAVKIIYWIATGLVILGMLTNVYNYFLNPALKVAFKHLGFPDWFRVELGIAKLPGVITIAIPAVPARVKELAYFGFFLSFSSAIIAHYMVGDPTFNLVVPFIMLLLLMGSYISFHKVISQKLT